MATYAQELLNHLYKNVETQIDLNNNISKLKKGSVTIKYRNNKKYYYLSYRENGKVKSEYLGKAGYININRISANLEKRIKLENKIKELKKDEKEIRKLIKVVDKKIFFKEVYEIFDLVVLFKPYFESYKCKEVYLYGSYARNEAEIESDINLYIENKGAIKELEKKLTKASNKQVKILNKIKNLEDEYIENLNFEKILIFRS